MKYDSLEKSVDMMTDYTEFTTDQYIAGLTINNISNNPSLVDQVPDTGNPNSDYAGSFASRGIARYDTDFADELSLSDDTEMFALWNPTAQYTLSYTTPSEFSLQMDYENIDYYVDAKNATYSLFKPSGYYALRGSDADYSITMVTDKKASVTDWYALTVKGNDVDSVSLKKVSGGYVIKGNKLNNVKVIAENNNSKPSITFSTKYDSAFIYEINEQTIGIKVDTDSNGTYETKLNTATLPKITADAGSTSVTLKWTAVTGAESYGIAGYVNGSWQNLGESTKNTYTVSGLKPGTSYKLAVIAKVNGKWNKDYSNAVTVTPKTDTNKYPIVKSEVSGRQFRIKWTAVSGAEKYGIAVYQSGGWRVKVQLNGNTTTYTSPKMKSGTYKMVVCAKINGSWDTSNIKSRAFIVTLV